jgi:uncharacterized protein
MSFEWIGMAIFIVLTILPALPFLFLVMRRIKGPAPVRWLAVSFVFAVGVYTAVWVDAFRIEPNWPRFDRVEIEADIPRPLTILHLSDLHIEAVPTARDRWLLERLAEITPDIAVVTGDIHQMEMLDPMPLNGILGQIHARLGVFGCIGYDNTRVLKEAAPGLCMLQNEGIVLDDNGSKIGVCGLLEVTGRDKAYDAIAGARFRIALNHTPDLADEAAGKGADLYLCGHTHGGQVRIPFWGAIITNSGTGKEYEAGLYRRGTMHIYTSRGFGLEPRPAPQVRFFCRPQITLITVHPRTR